MRRRSTLAAGCLAGAALALSGCQGVDEAAIDAQPLTEERRSDPVTPIGPGGELSVEAGEFFFEITGGAAVDGPVTINLDNIGSTVHNFRIDAAAGDRKKVEAEAGEAATGTLELFAGEYTYYCDVPGHRSAGMEGELTVYATEEEAQEAPAGGGTGTGGTGTEGTGTGTATGTGA